jgi:hypothetical protein
MRSFVKFLSIVVAFLLPAVALAEDKVPEQRPLEMLVKTSLLSLNDAVVTGDYSVFHAKLAKPFREQFPVEKLAATFASFSEKHLDIGVISTYPPTYDDEPSIDDKGRLLVKGYFPTEPSRCYFDLKFIPDEGIWKLVGINVNVKKPD